MVDDKASERLKIEIDEDGITVYVVLVNGDGECDFTEDWVNKQLQSHNLSGLSVLKSADKEITELVSKNLPGRVNLGQKVDAKVTVKVSNDLLSASLFITAAKGGKDVSTEEVVRAIKESSCDLDLVNKKRVVGLVKKSHLVEPGETIDVIIAIGRAPQHGKDTQFEYLIEGVFDRKPHKRNDGTLDYYDLGEIVSVEAGCALMKKHPPTLEVTGITVTGEELAARVAKKLNFKKCKGAIVSPSNPDLLVAEIKGQPVVVNNGVKVDDVCTVKKVDLHTGHIEYDGSVVVKGDVVSGMKIKVTGDVQVFGMIENASIEASGNVDIKLGAIGHVDKPGDEHGMQIKCAGNLSASYLENVDADVEGDALIKSRVSNCKINAGHQIVVGNPRQEKSGIVGGHVFAGSIIRAEVIGSSGCALTQVGITCSAELKDNYDNISKQIVEKDEVLIKKLGLMVGLAKKHTEESKQSLAELKEETENIKLKVNELINQKSEFESAMETASLGKVIAQKEAHPGVTIKIMDQSKEIKSKYKEGTFLLHDGVIVHNGSVD